jgi:DNA (cytosine-5)-methyltransferase 1
VNFLSLFSGIEAASQAWGPLGWRCVGFSEIEKFPSNVLQQRHPGVPNLGDVTKITETDIMLLGPVDVIVFGSPCQDLSVAGKRKGLDGARSGLFFTAMVIIGWARRWCGLRFALWENVPGAFTSNGGADFGAVVDALAGLAGTAVPPKGWGTEGVALGEEAMVEWATLDAQWFGVAQRRRRVFALADFGDWTRRPPVLLEPQGVRGDSAPRRDAGETVARTLAASSGGSDENDARDGRLVACGLRRPVSLAFGGNNTSGPIEVGTALNASGTASGRLDFESETFVVEPAAYMPHRTLRDVGYVEEGFAQRDVCDALHTSSGSGNKAPVIAFQSSQSGVRLDEVHATLDGNNGSRRHNGALVDKRVRRLTPLECERLQAFPDDYTAVQVVNRHGKLTGRLTKDGPRYKALGNSMCVNVMAWIGQQVEYAMLLA